MADRAALWAEHDRLKAARELYRELADRAEHDRHAVFMQLWHSQNPNGGELARWESEGGALDDMIEQVTRTGKAHINDGVLVIDIDYTNPEGFVC
jgi:hypothetical protein